MDISPRRYFLMIGHLGNADSVNSTDLPNADTLHYTIAKTSLISPLILSVKQIFFFLLGVCEYAITRAMICAKVRAVLPTIGFVPCANVNPAKNANNIFMVS